MKKLISISALTLLLVSLFSLPAISQTAKATKTTVATAAKVEVFYFHYTRRCATCQAVEAESQKAIQALYPSQLKSGVITFKSLNLDEATSKSAANKCKADGQSLLIISKGKRIDLTDKAFMYAKETPEKLKTELKKAMEPLLK